MLPTVPRARNTGLIGPGDATVPNSFIAGAGIESASTLRLAPGRRSVIVHRSASAPAGSSIVERVHPLRGGLDGIGRGPAARAQA